MSLSVRISLAFLLSAMVALPSGATVTLQAPANNATVACNAYFAWGSGSLPAGHYYELLLGKSEPLDVAATGLKSAAHELLPGEYVADGYYLWQVLLVGPSASDLRGTAARALGQLHQSASQRDVDLGVVVDPQSTM